MQRKDFLQKTTMILLGGSSISSYLHGKPGVLGKIGLQLYTVRNEMEKDIRTTLKKIADIGFHFVETAFWPKNISPETAASYLKEAGLSVFSAHIELPVGDNKTTMLEVAKAYNCNKMIWHGWPEDKRYGSLEGTKELAKLYNEASRLAKDNGLQFGIHNHWWEFRNKVDGHFVFEILLEELDRDIFFEIDTYWVKVAGHDPATIVKRFGNRAPLLHIKDGPAKWHPSLAEDNPEPMTAAGMGTQNFPAIVKAANGNTEWMIVEMDKVDGDVFDALQVSFDYLTKNKLALAK